MTDDVESGPGPGPGAGAVDGTDEPATAAGIGGADEPATGDGTGGTATGGTATGDGLLGGSPPPAGLPLRGHPLRQGSRSRPQPPAITAVTSRPAPRPAPRPALAPAPAPGSAAAPAPVAERAEPVPGWASPAGTGDVPPLSGAESTAADRDDVQEEARQPVRTRHSPGLSALLLRQILLGAALAMLLFALPLAVSVSGRFTADELNALARDAERGRAAINDRTLTHPELLAGALPRPSRERGSQLGLYDAQGHLVAGTGPARPESIVFQVIRNSVEQQGQDSGWLVVAVPVNSDDAPGHALVIRAGERAVEVHGKIYLAWTLMTGLALFVLAVVAGLGRAQARRIARPLQSLATAANALGHGDFSVRAVPAGVAEVDAVSANLERTARRIGGMLERERSFSADASHQLRTPLTAVRLGLESALLTPGADLHEAVEEALGGLDRLEQTVLDLLALARDTSGPREATDVAELLTEAARPWDRALAEHDRRLELRIEPDLPRVAVSQPALRTVLDVLLGNALVHGAGVVRVVVRATADTAVLEVTDEGPGLRGDPTRIFARRSTEAKGTGIGLALARSLVEADGGRLELTRVKPATFALLLPVAPNGHQHVRRGVRPRARRAR